MIPSVVYTQPVLYTVNALSRSINVPCHLHIVSHSLIKELEYFRHYTNLKALFYYGGEENLKEPPFPLLQPI